MLRLEGGDCASAERFLRRALKVEGGPQYAVKNDLSLALSGLGRHEEAETLIREVVAAAPKDWNFQDSLAHVLRAAGKQDEANAVQRAAYALANEQNELKAYGAVKQSEAANASGGMPKDAKGGRMK